MNTLKTTLFAIVIAIAGTAACVEDDKPEGSNPDAADAGVVNTLPACADGTDNDHDGTIDANDPGCHSDGNANNPSSYVPSDTDETNTLEPARGCRGGGGFMFESTWRRVATVEKWPVMGPALATLAVGDYTLEFTNAQMPWAGRIRYYAGGPLTCAMTANDSNGQNVGFDVMTGIWDWRTDREVPRWYKTGCNWLPFHNTRELGITWDFNCGEPVYDVAAPIVLPQ